MGANLLHLALAAISELRPTLNDPLRDRRHPRFSRQRDHGGEVDCFCSVGDGPLGLGSRITTTGRCGRARDAADLQGVGPCVAVQGAVAEMGITPVVV